MAGRRAPSCEEGQKSPCVRVSNRLLVARTTGGDYVHKCTVKVYVLFQMHAAITVDLYCLCSLVHDV